MTVVDLDSPGDTVIRPATLAHVFLRTNKFDEMVAFYKKFLNAEARFESSRIAFLCFDEEHHRIAISAMPGTSEKMPSSAGLEHIAFGFNSLQDLALAYRQRKKLGMEPTWCVNHGITMSIYYKDPDGNHLETQVDLFDNNGDATDFMLSDEFKRNPIGTDFDPEEFVRRLQSGEDLASIKKRPEIGTRGTPAHLLNKH
ncbi:related to Biphenyl-2,3-diol 1,2-dioxygenase 2 [Phialocephala subalpina]|uniref:Related to Biphenyl-2,3-diol 1,2-dioxygenase 2 n=1 Tax=Phialocephala subalpina TaxID=576137 RepID=A0A1L7XUP7_9HELO|nr:related to Biphenyl-2,3-diol 1,2-dioxygenase 2 [Phialocephala subalpina]